MRRQPTTEQMQAQCDAFNAAHPVGSPIEVWTGLIEGAPKAAKVREPAQILSGHTAVVYIDVGRGCVALTHVRGRGGLTDADVGFPECP